jgi:hypothetical protein
MGGKKIAVFFLFLIPFCGFSQSVDTLLKKNPPAGAECNCPELKKGKGTFYGAWGYNRDWFSTSDLHFQNSGSDNYDFTLYNVQAKDRSGFKQILRTAAHGDISIPQYSYRFGYYFNDKHNLGVEFNFDHAKYVMVQEQTVHVKGQIHDAYIDKDTVLDSGSFLRFEHTNGANFFLANFLKRASFLHSPNKKHWLSTILKSGAGIMIPKTDVTLFGTRLDNKFHIAGWLIGMEPGLRYDYRNFFLETTVKGSFVNYTNVLTIGTGRANHHFWCFEAIATAGFQLGL